MRLFFETTEKLVNFGPISLLCMLFPSKVTDIDLFQDDHCATRRIIFTYPMIAYTDMEDTVKAEVMEIATNACEKFLNDNQSVNNISWIT